MSPNIDSISNVIIGYSKYLQIQAKFCKFQNSAPHTQLLTEFIEFMSAKFLIPKGIHPVG
jgi:hypothetical protein